MLHDTVEHAHCLQCQHKTTVMKIPGAAPGTGSTTPEYRCDNCGYQAVIFWVDDDFYLGRGHLSEISRIPGLIP